MSFRKAIEREKYVVIHGQTTRFRIRKYLVLAMLATFAYVLGDWNAVLWTLGSLSVVSIGIHFLFRWKTKAWTESWGPYKKMDLPG